MRAHFLPAVVLTLLLFPVGSSPAAPPAADPIPAQIASLPWAKSHAEIPVPASEARIAIKATYSRPDLVQDTDICYIGLAKTDWGTSLEKSLHGRKVTGVKMRSYSGGDLKFCKGQGEVLKANKEGFDFLLDLDWKFVDGKKGRFRQTFRGAWVKTQTFQKDGFTVTLQVLVP